MKKKFISILLILLMGTTACGLQESVSTGRQKSVVERFVKMNPNYNSTEDSYKLFSNSVDYCESVTVATECCKDEPVIFNTEEYSVITEHGFSLVKYAPLSTFAADVDTASYSNVRRFIESGYTLKDIPKGAVRTEELINYFNYNYNLPENGAPFAVTTEIGNCPWNEDSKLVSIGIKTDKIDFSETAPSNIVFLIDVSGSMFADNKLPLLVKSFKLLVNELGEKDKVSIVTYAGEDKILLEGVPASDKERICEALDSLEANGCTNGGQGIISAYRLAEKNYIKDGNNRVILATDGDLNVGVTSASDLEKLIKEESKTGIFLTVLGFGSGNYSDERMETLADKGNGNYAYIDSIAEAKKVLCEELGATMVTVAKDVKLQVEFNPAVVAEYRLIGYEDRTLQPEDFNDDTKDAGEIGAGHSVTALYEIVTVDKYKGDNASLKYQDMTLSKASDTDEWLTVSIRYKKPDEDKSELLSYPVGNDKIKETNSDDFMFAAIVAEFSQILRAEEYVNGLGIRDVYKQLQNINLCDAYRMSFKEMVSKLIENENM